MFLVPTDTYTYRLQINMKNVGTFLIYDFFIMFGELLMPNHTVGKVYLIYYYWFILIFLCGVTYFILHLIFYKERWYSISNANMVYACL